MYRQRESKIEKEKQTKTERLGGVDTEMPIETDTAGARQRV